MQNRLNFAFLVVLLQKCLRYWMISTNTCRERWRMLVEAVIFDGNNVLKMVKEYMSERGVGRGGEQAKRESG